MSHEISEIDRQQGLSQAWHGLTEVLPVINLKNEETCWLRKWDVKALVLGVMDQAGKFITSAFQQLVCTDNESISIGQPINPKTYSVLTNAGFLAICQDALDRIPGAIVESVGSVCRRARVFVSIRVPKMETFQAAGREFKPYLNFLSSHDKSAPFVAMFSCVCTVCNNTFGFNLNDVAADSFRVSVRHTSGMQAAIKDVPAMIEAFMVSVQKFAERMDALVKIPVSVEDARAFFAGFLTDKLANETADKSKAEVAEISTRKLNQIDRLTELFQTGKGNAGVNLADLFSAVTDYYTHESSGGDDKFKQVASSEFGNGAAMKSLAYVILGDDKRTAATIASGHKVLALVPKE